MALGMRVNPTICAKHHPNRDSSVLLGYLEKPLLLCKRFVPSHQTTSISSEARIPLLSNGSNGMCSVV